MRKDIEVAEYQGKQHVVLKFAYEQKHEVFNLIGEGRRKKELCDEFMVLVMIVV